MKHRVFGLVNASLIFLLLPVAQTHADDLVCSGCVDTGDIAESAVTSNNIKNGTLTAVDLAPNAVVSSRIKDGSVTGRDIANNAVDSNKIKNGSVIAADIADSAVTSDKIRNGTVTAVDLAPDAVVSSRIKDGSVTVNDIANNAIVSSKITDSSVMTVDIADGAITEPKLDPSLLALINDYDSRIADLEAQIATLTGSPSDVTLNDLINRTYCLSYFSNTGANASNFARVNTSNGTYKLTITSTSEATFSKISDREFELGWYVADNPNTGTELVSTLVTSNFDDSSQIVINSLSGGVLSTSIGDFRMSPDGNMLLNSFFSASSSEADASIGIGIRCL